MLHSLWNHLKINGPTEVSQKTRAVWIRSQPVWSPACGSTFSGDIFILPPNHHQDWSTRWCVFSHCTFWGLDFSTASFGVLAVSEVSCSLPELEEALCSWSCGTTEVETQGHKGAFLIGFFHSFAYVTICDLQANSFKNFIFTLETNLFCLAFSIVCSKNIIRKTGLLHC